MYTVKHRADVYLNFVIPASVLSIKKQSILCKNIEKYNLLNSSRDHIYSKGCSNYCLKEQVVINNSVTSNGVVYVILDIYLRMSFIHVNMFIK